MACESAENLMIEPSENYLHPYKKLYQRKIILIPEIMMPDDLCFDKVDKCSAGAPFGNVYELFESFHSDLFIQFQKIKKCLLHISNVYLNGW